MSPSNRKTLNAIAAELRTLPDRGDSPAERLESAGRLLIQAMEAGAFSDPRYAGFKAMVHQRLERLKGNDFISAWTEAVSWLKEKPLPDIKPQLELCPSRGQRARHPDTMSPTAH